MMITKSALLKKLAKTDNRDKLALGGPGWGSVR